MHTPNGSHRSSITVRSGASIAPDRPGPVCPVPVSLTTGIPGSSWTAALSSTHTTVSWRSKLSENSGMPLPPANPTREASPPPPADPTCEASPPCGPRKPPTACSNSSSGATRTTPCTSVASRPNACPRWETITMTSIGEPVSIASTSRRSTTGIT
jgi:hypothetical protein